MKRTREYQALGLGFRMDRRGVVKIYVLGTKALVSIRDQHGVWAPVEPRDAKEAECRVLVGAEPRRLLAPVVRKARQKKRLCTAEHTGLRCCNRWIAAHQGDDLRSTYSRDSRGWIHGGKGRYYNEARIMVELYFGVTLPRRARIVHLDGNINNNEVKNLSCKIAYDLRDARRLAEANKSGGTFFAT